MNTNNEPDLSLKYDILNEEIPDLYQIFPILIYDLADLNYFYKICFTNEFLDKEILLEYFNRQHIWVKCFIAKHIDLLYVNYLINTKCSSVKLILIRRQLSPKSIEILSNDSDDLVREFLTDIESYGISLSTEFNKEYLTGKEFWNNICLKLINDKSEKVRCNITKILYPYNLHLMMNDSSSYVRICVASKIEYPHLIKMIYDENYKVRLEVANRINPIYLPLMFNDSNKDNREYIKDRYKRKIPFLKRMERIIFNP